MKLETKEVIQKQPGTEREDIHIGLVLAGAVTAGAYTAGVLDYLLNTLDLWYEKHAEDPDNVAKPNVIIDAITGASAGSIVAAVTLMALYTKRYKNVEKIGNQVDGQNLLFDTWVNLGMKSGESITEKLFSASDLEKEGVKSLLNTDWIDDMIKSLIAEWEKTPAGNMPDYIHKDLKVLMTLSNLRGIPLKLSFSNGDGAIAHTMSYHKAFAHFKLTQEKEHKDKTTFPLNLQNKTDVELLLDCSRASGAFPIGLKSVKFPVVSKAYIEENLKEIFKGANVTPDIDDDYQFLAVDGGMTNNEPIAEAMRILNPRPENGSMEKKIQKIFNESKDAGLTTQQLLHKIEGALEHEKKANKPIIMIDPFPNFSFESTEARKYEYNDGLFQVIPQLLETLRNQVLFKESDIADLFSNDSQKGMIWPTRRSDDGKKYRNAIASAALGGFAGFFHKDFLKHDYMLGQKNCQRFLRNYFYQDYEKSNWPDAMKAKFDFMSDADERSLPIIPDYRITKYISETRKFEPELEIDAFPKVSYEELKRDLRPKISRRVGAILNRLEKEMKDKKAEAKKKAKLAEEEKKKARDEEMKNPETAIKPMAEPQLQTRELIVAKPFRRWLMNLLFGPKVVRLLFKFGKYVIKGQVSRWILNRIIQELDNHELFTDSPEKPENILSQENTSKVQSKITPVNLENGKEEKLKHLAK